LKFFFSLPSISLSGKKLLEILKVIIGNIAIKAKAIDCSRNINSPFNTKPVNEERH